MIKSKTKWVSLLLICLSQLAFSLPLDPERAYQVEVIAFKHQGVDANQNESFSAYPALPNINKAKHLLPYTIPPRLYSAVPANKLRLKKEVQKIADNPAYTLLAHYGWYQEEGKSRLLRFEGFDEESQALPDTTIDLDGTIRVSKGRYYYVSLDLLLPPHFALKETRRVRKDEIHYIDHPAFGLLVLVHPLK